jgi:hypothetical protein
VIWRLDACGVSVRMHRMKCHLIEFATERCTIEKFTTDVEKERSNVVKN